MPEMLLIRTGLCAQKLFVVARARAPANARKNGFYKEIVPEKCKFRVSSSGQRITITLAKLEPSPRAAEVAKG